MIDDHHLHLLIDEELFVLNEKLEETNAENLGSPMTPEERSTPVIEKPKSPNPTHYDFVVVTDSLTNNDEELLKKILKAINLTLEQVAVFQGPVKLEFSFERLLCFGPITQINGLNATAISNYQIDEIENGQLLLSTSLLKLQESKDEKIALWSALKKWV
ncbi:MAG: DNA polymerase III subunit psi [Cyclobacteriaceae bacterium]|nr:DNA polymerase III subunit psi [Cyclobacteriaceae bacterium HetDA_MAG_MS6]